MDLLKPGHVGDEGAGAFPKNDAGDPPQPAYLEKGDVFRTLGLPDDLIIGLDAMALTTNSSLRGFRDIPSGVHLLWLQQPGSVSRCGYWFKTGTQGLLRIKEWDRYNEMLGEPANLSEARGDMESVYPTLKPYTLHDHENRSTLPMDNRDPTWARSPASLWNTLTGAMSSQALRRITGRGDANEYLVDSMDGARDTRSVGSPSTNSGLNFLFTQDFRDLQVLDQGSTRTRVADTSPRVQTALATTTDNQITEQDMLAELQFTFLTGTHLSNSACLEQWWSLVLKIVLRAYSLSVSHPRLVTDLLTTLYAQLFYTEHYVASSSSEADHPDDPDGKGTKQHGPSGDNPIFQYKPVYRGKLRQMLAEYKKRLNDVLQG